MANKYYVGDVGTDIIVDCGQDISAATGTKLLVLKPNGAEVEWTATIYNTNYLKYTVQAGDFDQTGEYRLQSYMTLSAWTGRGEVDVFHIEEAFKL